MATKKESSKNKKIQIDKQNLELLVIENRIKLPVSEKIKNQMSKVAIILRIILSMIKKILGVIFNKIKVFIKSGKLKRAIKKTVFLILFFFACYISMELLNGVNISFADICIAPWNQKGSIILGILKQFFLEDKFIYNYLVFIGLYFIIYGITNRNKLTCGAIYTFTVVFGSMNYIVKKARGVSISLCDIYSVNTAASVSSGITMDFDGNFIVAITIFIISILTLCFFIKFKDKENKKRLRTKMLTVLIGIILIMSVFMNKKIMNKIELWDLDTAYENVGANLTIMRMLKDFKIQKPENYDKKEVEKTLEKYADDTKNYNGKQTPNVIIVANESFFDVTDVYDIKTAEDNIPFFHKLIKNKNTVSGIVHTSTFGGGTSNVEYEALTQNTVGFLPIGASPYQQYINKPVQQSIVSYMNNLGYNTNAIHPFYGNGYSRIKVYDFLGFKEKMFIDDMDKLSGGLNGYVSDECTYNYVAEKMNERPKGEKKFSFVLTMQNHMPYTVENLEKTRYVEDSQLNSYLQVQNQSDEALKNLVEYIDSLDEDTIMLFFGDHQPNLNILKTCNTKYKDEEAQYIIPFVIYANFDIEGKTNIETSTNYLQDILLEAAKMPKNSYTKYISELRKEIPVLSSNYYKDKEGNIYELKDETSPLYDKVQNYWSMIYYQIFNN